MLPLVDNKLCGILIQLLFLTTRLISNLSVVIDLVTSMILSSQRCICWLARNGYSNFKFHCSIFNTYGHPQLNPMSLMEIGRHQFMKERMNHLRCVPVNQNNTIRNNRSIV